MGASTLMTHAFFSVLAISCPIDPIFQLCHELLDRTRCCPIGATLKRATKSPNGSHFKGHYGPKILQIFSSCGNCFGNQNHWNFLVLFARGKS